MNLLHGKIQLTNAQGDIDPTAYGYDYAIRTTTEIRAKVIEQKFYDLINNLTDYAPIAVGQGQWKEDIRTNLTYDIAGDFEEGIVGTASGINQVPTVDAAIAPKTTALATWMKGYKYSIIEIEKALASGNWDMIESRQKALVRNWRLGLQRILFLGMKSDNTNFPGILSNSEVLTDVDVAMTKPIRTMTATEFQAFVGTIVGIYQENANYTVYPNTFVIPSDDYNGLARASSPDFPIGSMLEYLKKSFVEITGDQNFKVLPLAYSIPARSEGLLTNPRYILYNNNPDSIAQDIPVDFTWKGVNTAQNIMFEGAGCGQFSGLTNYRIREMVYFEYTP